jgi:hypothetical protein
MVLGISLALLLLPGGTAATATPPDGPPFAEHDIPISDDPGGGGGSLLKNCVKHGPDSEGLCWVSYDVLGTHIGKTKKMPEAEAVSWMRDHCENH